MADQFQNPANQADLTALRAALQKLDSEVVGMKDQLSAELAAVREAERAGQAARREGGGTAISSTPATGPLEAQQKLIDQQVLSYQALNAEIERRIQLEQDALAATARTTGAVGAAPAAAGAAGVTGVAAAESAAARADAALAELQARGGLGFQAAGSVQRVRNALATGEIGGEGVVAGKASQALNELSLAQERAAATARGLAAGELDAREGLAAAAMTAQEFDTKLASTGALSGTALTALGNGTITLRDLGHQLTETIGKFGGWTLAAGAVYGVLGGLNEVRQGAVATNSALQGLTKFLPPGAGLNTEHARQQIIQQAQATGTPISDVGDTAQQFAKAFKTQPDVFTATHVALTAAKLDNIQLADSYKYLTAIVQETGMNVQHLPALFDQITAAQDKFGARVSQLLPAYSGSIGAVQTAHGDPNQLLGLEALALKRTGRSGSVIATAFARGATNFFPTAGSRGTLSRLGIDPNQGVTQALVEAIQKAPGMSPGERRQVSESFFGKLRGSQMTPLFRSPPQQLAEALQVTAPGAHPGLANQQLSKTMQQADQQLNLLKINLQAIGGELAGSGAGSPFGLMLKGMNDMLEYSTKLMAVWDSMPTGAKETASYLALAAASVAAMRRFNVGGMMANSSSPILNAISPVFARSPQAQLRSQVNASMASLGTSIDQQISTASQRYVTSMTELTRAQDQLAELDAAGLKANQAYTAAMERAALAADAMAVAQTDIAELRAVRDPASMAAIRQTMLFGPTARPANVEGPLMEEGAFFSKVGPAAEEEASKLTTAMAAVGTGMTFLASNAIPLAIAGFIAFAAIKGEADATHKAQSQALDQLQNAKTPREVQAAIDAYQHSARLPTPFGTINLSNLGIISGQDPGIVQAGRAAMANVVGRGIENNTAFRAYIQSESDSMHGHMRDAYRRVQTDKAFRDLGSISLPTPFGGSFKLSYQDALKRALIGYEGKAVGGKTNPFLMWEQAGQDPTNQLVPMMQSFGAAATVYGTQGKNNTFQKLAAGYAYMVEKFGKNPLDVKSMQALASAQGEIAGRVDKQVTDLLNLADTATTSKGEQGYIQKALGSVSQAESKVKAMFAAAEKIPGANVQQLKAAEQQFLGLIVQKRQEAIQRELQLVQSETALSVSNIIGVGPGFDLDRAVAQLRGDQSALSKARSMGADAKTINDLQQAVNNQANTVLQDRINYWTQLAQVNTAVAAGQTADPVQQTQIQINQLNALLAHFRSMGISPSSQTYRAVVGQIGSLGLTQVSQQLGQWQATQQAQLSGENIGQPTQVVLQNNLAAANAFLAHVQSLGNKIDPTTVQNAIAADNAAKDALAQWAISEGAALIQADAALAESKTFDPVQQAIDKLRGDEKQLAYDLAHHASASQITQDKATIHSDIKGKLEAEWQKRESSIMYLMNTYQITGATAIERLQKLYNSMKKAGASYADLQRVGQELYSLKFGGGDLNLNTGSIHLPSTYEVKSAIMRGGNVQRRKTAAGMVADVKTDVKMNVYVNRDADVRKVAKAISDALGTSVQGLTQATGIMN